MVGHMLFIACSQLHYSLHLSFLKVNSGYTFACICAAHMSQLLNYQGVYLALHIHTLYPTALKNTTLSIMFIVGQVWRRRMMMIQVILLLIVCLMPDQVLLTETTHAEEEGSVLNSRLVVITSTSSYNSKLVSHSWMVDIPSY